MKIGTNSPVIPTLSTQTAAKATPSPELPASPADQVIHSGEVPAGPVKNGAAVAEQWSDIQSPPTTVQTLKSGALQVDTCRWGFKEQGETTKDWPGIFKDATIDPKHIKNVYLGVKPFAPKLLAAHSVLIFEMDEDHPVTNSAGQKDAGLVISMEARLHQGEEYKLTRTLNGSYGVVYQLGTMTDLVEKTTRREPNHQIRYKLDLNSEQKEQLLRNTLEMACADHKDERYNLFTHSCHSICIDLVNSVIPDSQKIKRWLAPHIYNPMVVFPPYGDIVFAGHHLLAHEDRLMIQPDATLHPGLAKGPTRLGQTVESLSSSSLWKPSTGLLGAAAGGALGAAVHCLPPAIGISLGAIGGAWLGTSLGETLRRRTHTDFQSNKAFLPPPG